MSQPVAWLGGTRNVGGSPARQLVIGDRLWSDTLALWRELPPHPVLLQPLAVDDGQLWVQYAELQEPDSRDDRHVARWLADILDLFVHVEHHMGVESGFLARPALGIDALGHAHVAFLPATRADAPHSVRDRFPDVGHRTLVGVASELVSTFAGSMDLVALCRRLRAERSRNYRRVGRALLVVATSGLARPGRDVNDHRAWSSHQRGLGFAELGDYRSAIDHQRVALLSDPALGCARDELDRLEVASATGEVPRPRFGRNKLELLEEAMEAGASRRFHEARDLYTHANTLEGKLGLARCLLALDNLDAAIATATAIDVASARWIEIAARHRRGEHGCALACAAQLPDDDAAVWYVRGRAQLGLRKLGDARASLDRACALRPGYPEAMLLRREAERAVAGLLRDLGRDPQPAPPTGPHANAIAQVLAGRIDDAIALLEPRGDRDAKLMRASCLAFRARHDEAAALFGELDGTVAAVGRADALLALGRAADALAAYDAVLAIDAFDVAALDGRARALDALGAPAPDREAAHRRALAFAVGRAAR